MPLNFWRSSKQYESIGDIAVSSTPLLEDTTPSTSSRNLRYTSDTKYYGPSPSITQKTTEKITIPEEGNEIFFRQEQYIPTQGRFNKIFSSTWIDRDSVIFGTKDNQVIMLDTRGRTFHALDRPYRSGRSTSKMECGVHMTAVNEQQTLLAVGGERPEDGVLYDTHTLEAKAFLVGHNDWIFGGEFINWNTLVTGGRDGKLCIWKCNNVSTTNTSHTKKGRKKNKSSDNLPFMKPVHSCNTVYVQRALASYSHDTSSTVLSITSDGRIFGWDMEKTTLKLEREMQGISESVCLNVNNDNSLVAIGSKHSIHFHDLRTQNERIKSVESQDRYMGVRSLQWRPQNILSIGGGVGRISLFDVRSMRYIVNTNGPKKNYMEVSRGWVVENDAFYGIMNSMNELPPVCIYTHTYNPADDTLFIGGGPTISDLEGSLVSLYSK